MAGVLVTLSHVFGDLLPPVVVQEVYQAEGDDVKCCLEVLWELLPQVFPIPFVCMCLLRCTYPLCSIMLGWTLWAVYPQDLAPRPGLRY
jgi:hypothetical protein